MPARNVVRSERFERALAEHGAQYPGGLASLNPIIGMASDLLAMEPVSNGQHRSGLATDHKDVRALPIVTPANRRYLMYYAFTADQVEMLDLSYRPDTIWDADVQDEF